MAYLRRQDVYSCDRCGVHIHLAAGRVPSKLVILTDGDKRAEAELCSACLSELNLYMRRKEGHET